MLTGGGSAGHVTPNLALIDALIAEGWEVHYAGSAEGIERRLVEGKVAAYHVVPVGKLRRIFPGRTLAMGFAFCMVFGLGGASSAGFDPRSYSLRGALCPCLR